MKIGFVVNPIAGIGAKRAWKGTDDIEKAWNILLEGYPSEAMDIAHRALKTVNNNLADWVVTNEEFSEFGKLVYRMPIRSKPKHTKEATKKLIEEEVDIIVFVGGDGTAADVSEIGYPAKVPILGIPAGVKIFSGVFLHRPEDLGSFLQEWTGEVKLTEIEDLDEEAYRKGIIRPKTVHAAYIPVFERVQQSKSTFHSSESPELFEGIAQRIEEENLLKGTILVGGGSTLFEIFRAMDLEKSLLGVDVFQDGRRVIADASYEELIEIDADEIWVTPIGQQGHLFGRGNRQIPPKLIHKIGKRGIRIFATPVKMANTPILYIDTGDPKVDEELKGYYKVIIGYHDSVVRKAI